MNLGPQRISDTFQLVLNQSGNSITLGNGNDPNLIGTIIVSATGTQTISGVKTFNSTINANITGSAGSATSATSAVSASGLFLTTSDGNASSTTMYPVLFSGTTVGGNQRAHIDSAGLSYNASTNALTATSFVGNASTAATLTTSRTINGTGFNGGSNITIEPYIESDNSTNALRYLTFVDSSTDGYQRLNESSSLTYNPSSGSLTINNLILGTQSNKATISYNTNTARTFVLPSVTDDSTFAFINQAQTFTSNQTINADLRVQGNLDFGASTLGGTAASSFFKTNAGQLGTTAGNALNLASIGFGSTNQSSLSFIARRQSNGSDWTTAAIGLSYNVDNTTPVNNQQIWLLPGGNVGVGTNAATEKLHVNGNLKVDGLITTNTITSTNGITIPNASASLTADVAMPTSNTWVNGPSISLTAGKWLVQGHVTFQRTTTTATTWFARISNNVLHYASSQMYTASLANITASIALTSIIDLTSTQTIILQGASNAGAAACLMKAATWTNSVGNNATQITAIRIG